MNFFIFALFCSTVAGQIISDIFCKTRIADLFPGTRCDNYYQCIDSEHKSKLLLIFFIFLNFLADQIFAVLMPCPPGLQFSVVDQVCVHPANNVGCP